MTTAVIIVLAILVLIYIIYLLSQVNKNKDERIKNKFEGKQNKSSKQMLFFIVFSAILIAIGAVLKIFGIMITTNMRISLFNIPIIIAGFICGMEFGIITGFGVDLTYSMFSGYAYNPAFTLSAIYWGILGGIFNKLYKKNKLNVFKVFLGVLITSLLETHTNLLVTYLLYGTLTTMYSLLIKYLILIIKWPIASIIIIVLYKKILNKVYKVKE